MIALIQPRVHCFLPSQFWISKQQHTRTPHKKAYIWSVCDSAYSKTSREIISILSSMIILVDQMFVLKWGRWTNPFCNLTHYCECLQPVLNDRKNALLHCNWIRWMKKPFVWHVFDSARPHFTNKHTLSLIESTDFVNRNQPEYFWGLAVFCVEILLLFSITD